MMRGNRWPTVVMCCIVFGGCLLAWAEERGRTKPMGYELYSWQDVRGIWNFSLLYNTDRNHTAKEIFNKKTVLRGLRQLKKRISGTAAGSTIFWVGRLPPGTGATPTEARRLSYPPDEMVREIEQLLKERGIKLVGSPPNGGQR
jgi:hypothetical protein